MATDDSSSCVYEEAVPLAPNCTSLDFDSGTIYSNGHDIDVINRINNNNVADVNNYGRRNCVIVTSSSSPGRAPAVGDVIAVESPVVDGRIAEVKELSWNEKLRMNLRRQQKKEQRSAAAGGRNTTDKQKSVGNRLSGSISKIFGKLSSSRLSLSMGLHSDPKHDDSVVVNSDDNERSRHVAAADCVEDYEDNMWSDDEFDAEDLYSNVDNSNSHLSVPPSDTTNSPSQSTSHPAHDVTVPVVTSRTQHSSVVSDVDSSRSRNTVFADVINFRSTRNLQATTSHDASSDEDYLEPVTHADNDVTPVTPDDVISSRADSDVGSQRSESGSRQADKCQQLPPVIAKRFKVASNGQLLTTTSSTPAAAAPDTSEHQTPVVHAVTPVTPVTPVRTDTAAAAAEAECDMSTGGRFVPQPPRFNEGCNSTPPLPVRNKSTPAPPRGGHLYPALPPPAYSEHDTIQKTPIPPLPVARSRQTVGDSSSSETSLTSSTRHSSTGSHGSNNSSAAAAANNNNNNNNTNDDVYENPDDVMEDDLEYEQVDGLSSSCVRHPLPLLPLPYPVSSVSPPSTKPRSQSLGNVLVADRRPAVKPKPTDNNRCNDSPAGLPPSVMGGVAVINGITPSDLVHAAGALNSTGVNVKRPVAGHSISCSPSSLQQPNNNNNNNTNNTNNTNNRPRPPVAQRSSVNYVNSSPGQAADELDQFVWYFGSADRAQCETKVVAVGRDGTFVVRKRTPVSQACPYALTMFYGGATYNLLIRQKNNSKYALGSEKPDENVFGSVAELVSFYHNNPIQLTNDRTTTNIIGKVFLAVSPSK